MVSLHLQDYSEHFPEIVYTSSINLKKTLSPLILVCYNSNMK